VKDKLNYIFGIRAAIETIEAGKTIDKILIKRGLKGELYNELFKIVRQNDIPFQYVPIEKLNRITRKNHQGVIAFVSSIEYVQLDNLVPQIYEIGENPLLLILDGVTDTRNLGAIARSAECAGVNGIIIPTKGAAMVTADAIKTSAGALNIIPVCRVENLKNTMTFLMESGIQIVAATEKSTQTFYEIDYTKPTAFVMGSEDKGISNEIIKLADHLVKIPLKGKISSLNVSVAASVMVFEAVRQRENLDKI
jgi:23S rRNA (guanosine2251-2'-O)-methyltransferase